MEEITSVRDQWAGIKRYLTRDNREIVVYPPGPRLNDPVSLADLKRAAIARDQAKRVREELERYKQYNESLKEAGDKG